MRITRQIKNTEVCLTCGDAYQPRVMAEVRKHWRKYPKHVPGVMNVIYEKVEAPDDDPFVTEAEQWQS